MGIKMGAAYDGDGKKWYAESYTKGQGKGPLKCEHCPALVYHKKAYSKETDGKPQHIPAHFALNPNERHVSGCQHAVMGEIKIIAKESEGLIEAINEGQYRLRLMMIKEAFSSSHSPKLSSNEKSSVEQKSKTYERSSAGKLSAYINSAKRVLEMRAICDDDAEIAEHLELVFEGDTVIPWQQFYIEIERYLEAFRGVRLNTVQYPFAIHGMVKSKRLNINGKRGSTNVLNLEKPKYMKDQTDETNGIRVEVSVWTENANWLDGIEDGMEVIILAPWKSAIGEKSSAKVSGKFQTYTTNKLSTTLVTPSQIIRVPTKRITRI